MKNKYKLLPKIWFIFSIGVAVFLYGVMVGKWGVFPASYLDKAVSQARSLNVSWFGTPAYVYPKVHNQSGAQTYRPEEVSSGLTLITSSWIGPDGWDPELRLIDEKGQILHRWRVDRGELFKKGYGVKKKMVTETEVHGSYLLPGGDVLLNLEYVGLVRLGPCGEVQWTLAEGNHHSIARAEDGSFWVPGVSERRRAGSDSYPDGFPGFSGRKVWIDQILHVSKEGKVIQDINVLDIIFKNDLEKFIFKYGGMVDTHLNDVEPLSPQIAGEYPGFEAGDLLVSLRNLNLVFVMDPSSGRVKWHVTGPFIAQHDPDFLGGGWIGLFDNNYDGTRRGSVLGGNRIVAFQPSTDSVEIRFPTEHSEPFYTGRQGKWQKLDNGNMLLTEASAGRVVEVNKNGRTVWEWIHPPTSNSKVAVVSKARRLDLTREDVASWPCSLVDSVGTSTRSR